MPAPANPSVSVGSRFVWANLVTASVALLVASLSLSAFQFFSLRSALLRDLSVQMHIVGDNGTAAIRFGDARGATELLEALKGSTSVMAAAFFNQQGERFASYTRRDSTRIESIPPDLLPIGHRFDRSEVELVEPVLLAGSIVGYIAIRADLDELYARLAAFAAATMLVGAGALGLSFLLVARLRQDVHRAERRLAHLAHVDPVTGLPNRNSYREHIEAAARSAVHHGSHFALLLLDIDNFKAVNDSFGHAGGDELLKLVGQRLVATMRFSDAVCRIGGDEFAIVAQGLETSQAAARVADNIVKALAVSFRLGERELWATASVGVTMFPDDAHDLATLLGNADTAMYAAKTAGRNGYRVFRPEMNARAAERLNIESDLRRALDAGLLDVHYQPQLDVRSGLAGSAEALARWNHPTRGPISPAEFIPIAEQSGLIGRLGSFVLRRACADAAAWNKHRANPFSVAVNLSSRELLEETLFDDIAGVLTETGLSPNLLEVEITESVLMRNMQVCLQTLHRLRKLGVRLAIDDFGTGYSSMAYLKGLPVNRLKIDRAFVRDLVKSESDRQLTAAMIAMAHALGLEVVAEGVENGEQMEILSKQGCDALQGFHVGHPLPAPSFAAWLAVHECGRLGRGVDCSPGAFSECRGCAAVKALATGY